MIHLVKAGDVDQVWPFLHRGMDVACRRARCRLTAVEIYQACRNGAWFLHVVIEDDQLLAGIATQVMGDVVTVHAMCGSDMDRWLSELINLELWKTLGVRRAEWGGRRGLKKIRGAKPVRTSFELELPHAG